MQHPFLSWRSGTALCALCFSLVGGAQARLADLAEIGVSRGDTEASAPGPWWTAFHEPVLATLEHAAQAQAYDPAADAATASARMLQRDAEVAAAYVGMRVFQVRLLVADEMLRSLAQQRSLLSAGPPTPQHAQVLTALDERIARAERHAAELRRRRDPFIVLLAERCGTTVEAMLTTLQPALALQQGPMFDAAAPQRLPRAVLAARPDVGAIEGRRLLERKLSRRDDLRPASWPGWIEASPRAEDAPAPSLPEAPDLLDVAAAAEREVRTDLSALQRLSRETARRAEVVEARRMELVAVQRRLEAGAAAPAELIAARQQLLIDHDLLLMAEGDLAWAWVKLHASTGGRALASAPPSGSP